MTMMQMALSRRAMLQATAAAALAVAGRPARFAAAAAPSEYRLTAAPGRAALVGAPYPDTAVWAYDGRVPGPEIRVRRGDRLRVSVENRLAEETTVHWHGVRVPNAMDGVPHLTQPPIAPGDTFVYEFDVPDAGTFWYHPHQRSFEQIGRGLYGALIVEEPDPVPIDRELTWVLDDWRLTADAAIGGDFGNFMDMSHAGRIGNTVTVNGAVPEQVAVRAGERLRLRLVNAANARIFALQFAGHRPQVVALDGQPVAPHAPDGDRVILGPAMRADLVIDMTEQPGGRFTVADTFYKAQAYRLLDLVYAAEAPLRERPLEAPVSLHDNPLSEPDLGAAERHEIIFRGGMMGGGMMGGGAMGGMSGGMMGGMSVDRIWSINGVSMTGHLQEPLLTLTRGRSYLLAMHNDTAWHHPIHLHGHSFRVVARNGRPTPYREWRDTVLTAPHESVDIALVADNPGDWMIHCHILEHQASGMMGVVRVT